MSLYLIFLLIAPVAGILFLRLFIKTKVKFILATGIAWVLYAVYEYLIYLRVFCSGECNIRIDLLLIYPILVTFTLVAVLLYLKHNKTKITRID